jgi:hypothetical protein
LAFEPMNSEQSVCRFAFTSSMFQTQQVHERSYTSK